MARKATGDAAELPKEAVASYESAVADYLATIDLNALTAEVYLKAAEVYMALGDIDAAIDILSRGYEATGDESLRKRMGSLGITEERSESVTVRGTIIWNLDEYGDIFRAYQEQYKDRENRIDCAYVAYGVRFEAPIQVTIGGETVYIQEASLNYDPALIDDQTQLHNFSTDTNGPLIGSVLEFQGHFLRASQTQELEPEYSEEYSMTFYNYRPNGDFIFFVEDYEVP